MKKTPLAAAAAETTGTPVLETPSSGVSSNADLDAMQAEADRVDGAALGVDLAGGEPVPAAIDYHLEASKMIDTIAAMLVGYCPPTAAVWVPERKAAVIEALVPVMQKYGITMDYLPCELVLIMVAGPALYQTAKLVAAQMREDVKKAAAERANNPAPDKPAKPGEVSGAPSTAVHPQTALYK